MNTLYKLSKFFLDKPMGSGLKEKEPKLSAVDRLVLHALAEVPYPVVGVDLSAWQTEVDWPKLSTKIYYAFIRAGRGNNYFDPYLQKNMLGARQTGRAYGLYWYMQPNTTSNFKLNVDSFVSVWADSGSQLPPVMDFEQTSLDKNGTMGWVIKAINRFVNHEANPNHIMPMIYTSAGWWNGNVARSDSPKDCLLWVANWTTAASPAIPDDWGAIHNPKTWTFWQYTSKLIGKDYGVSSNNLDGNRYHFTLAMFNNQFKTHLLPLDGSTPPTPPPPPTPTVYKAKVTATALNIRDKADLTGLDVGTLAKDDDISIYEESGDWAFTKGWVNKDYLTKI